MNDVLAFLFGISLGYLIIYFRLKDKKNDPYAIEILSNQVTHLEEELKYYKNLCHWHVEEKRKLQEIKYNYEKDCG
jgi:hypothetical protein